MKQNAILDVSNFVNITLVVEDVCKAAKTWSKWFGIPISEMDIRMVKNSYREADIELPAMQIILVEPELQGGIYRTHYEKHGTGIHHITFETEVLKDTGKKIQRKGYPIVLESKDEMLFETEDILGTNLCIRKREGTKRKITRSDSKDEVIIDGNGLIHIALIVHDVYRASEEWGELVGEDVSNMRLRSKGNHEKNGNPFDSRDHYRDDYNYGNGSEYEWIEADVHANGFLIELNQPDKAGPFNEYYQKHGTGLHHIAFRTGNKCDKLNDMLEEAGYSYIVDTYAPNNDRWPVHDTEDLMGTNLCVKPGIEFLTGEH